MAPLILICESSRSNFQGISNLLTTFLRTGSRKHLLAFRRPDMCGPAVGCGDTRRSFGKILIFHILCPSDLEWFAEAPQLQWSADRALLSWSGLLGFDARRFR